MVTDMSVSSVNVFDCPECGGELIIWVVRERPGHEAGSDVFAVCQKCDARWTWYREHEGYSHEKHRIVKKISGR